MASKYPNMRPSDKGFLGLRAALVGQWYQELPDKMKTTYTELAKQWNSEAPPREIQRQ